MTININDIAIDHYKTYTSDSFIVPVSGQVQYFDVSGRGDILLVMDNGYVVEDRFYPKSNFRAYVKIIPTTETKTGRYTIRLTDDKQNVIDIIGNLTVSQEPVLLPIITPENATIENNIVKADIRQDTATSTQLFLSSPSISWAEGLVTEYDVQPLHQTECSSDIVIAKTAIAITCASVSSDKLALYVNLSNPSPSRSSDDSYGFTKENAFNVSFSKEVVIQGTSYVLSFTIAIVFKQSQIVIEDRRCQTAIIDQYHQKILIAYDFVANVELAERQVSVGFDSTFNVPTKFSCFIPDATYIPNVNGRQRLPITIIAQSVTKSPTHYTMKIVLLPTLPVSRKLVSQRTNIPLTMSVRGQRHDFNIPVVLNG